MEFSRERGRITGQRTLPQGHLALKANEFERRDQEVAVTAKDRVTAKDLVPLKPHEERLRDDTPVELIEPQRTFI